MMSQQIMSGYQATLGIYNLTPDFARINGEILAPSIDNTNMGITTYRTFIGGLQETDIDFEGFWNEDAGASSAVLEAYKGVDNVLMMCFAGGTPNTGSGGKGFATYVSDISTIRSEQIGDMARIRFTAKGSGATTRVVPLYGLTTRTTSNWGNTYVLEAVPSGATLYGFLAVTAASGTGPSLTVKLRSSPDGVTFADRITFTATATTTTEVKSLSGPITDTYWRQEYTLSGTSPSFTFASAWGYRYN